MSTPYQQYPQTAAEGGQRGYLQGAPVENPVEAISLAFKHAFTYTGRASRSAFWWIFGLDLVVGGISRALTTIPVAGIVFGIIGFALFLTALAAAARRLHDTGRSAFWLFLILFVFIGWIWLLVYYLLPGTPGPNKYDDQYA